MNIIFSRMATLLVFGVAFGLFFIHACSTVEQAGVPENELDSAQQPDAELSRLNNEIANNPGNTRAYIEKSEVLFQLAKTKSPGDRQPIYQNLKDHSNAALYQDEIDQNAVEEILVNAWSHEQSNGIRLLQQDRSAGTNEQSADIIAHFTNAITVIPDSLVTYNLKAATLYETGKLNNAIETLKRAVSISGTISVELQEKLAYLYLESGDVEHSIKLYRQLVESYPEDQHLKHGLINAYIINNQHGEAIDLLSDLSDQFPSRHTYQEALATQIYYLFNQKSTTLLQQNRLGIEYIDEIEELRRMVEDVHSIFDELQATMPINEENTYRMAGFYKEAYLKFSALLDRMDFDDDVTVSEIMSQKEEFLALSLPLWERLAELNPDNLDYLHHLYQVYLHLDMEEDAQSLERSLHF